MTASRKTNHEITGKHGAKPLIHIPIGGLEVCVEPTILSTILGSCVSVCLFDPRLRIGAMNHILLPESADLSHFTNDSARYGVYSMELLINGMLKAGCKKSGMQAKVFGGGHVVSSMNIKNAPGERNIAFTLKFLDAEHIPIIVKDVGGNVCRRLYYHTDSFEVFIRRTKPQTAPDLIEAEVAAERQFGTKQKQAGEITLFDD